MRFNRRNWVKFFDGSNKKTTLRTTPHRLGKHNAFAGSYYKPIKLGEFEIIKVEEVKYNDLTEQDAKDDGFNSLVGLRLELLSLNGSSIINKTLFKHWIKNVFNMEKA